MGISGLLPLLKDIQNSKHLSEFRGQTLAVDGYVWLHRGTYGCAAEVATGKPTSKYVEYAMHRVRLLRHYGIQPYLVFDGGPLPAKQGTEDGRKQRREENLSRANTLAAQGKHSQAREFYVKCVDVTPQMAYQLIKALRAEGVPYVVAPYEADAQLAYLERVGVVDGIITEDSDLLVFGCKKVLFKLDTTTSKVTCISREDFAAVASTSTGGLSLRGWTDAQFRTMAILSGCDYLPSIPGIGLKTAWTLLRKHKTVENMLSALRLEGKKKVPTGYLDAFRLAEKVFLHQRVYDPAQEELIHLTPLPEDEAWDAEKEAYIGAYIEPSLAKQVAEGNACPISLLPMEDINPGFVPRALKTIPMNFASTSVARPDKGKGKAKELPSEKPSNAGLMKFFSPRMVQGREAPATTEAPSAAGPGRPAGAASTMAVGKKSGKRTLAEVMEEDMAAKRSRQEAALVASAAATATPRMPTTSKFFHGPQRSVSDPRGGRGWSRTVALATAGSPASQPQQPVAGSSGLLRCEKENVPCQEDARPEAVAGEEDVDLDVCMREPDAVVQEDGYVSPTESIAQWDSPDLSSPLRPGASKRRRSDGGGGDDWDEIDDADVLSSSPVAHTRTRKLPTLERERFVTVPRALPLRPVVNTNFSSRARRKSLGSKHGAVDDSINSADGSEDEAGRGPDLQNVFDDCDWDEITSGGEDDEDCEIEDKDVIDRTASSTPRPITLATEDGERCLLEESNSEELMASAAAAAAEAARNATVANGWWEKWARSGASTSAGGNRNHSDHDRIRHAAPALALAPLRRRETTMTPDGPRRPPRDPQRPNSAPQASKRKGFAQEDLRATGRRGSLIFTKTEDVKVTPKAGGKLRAGASSGGPGPRTSASSSSGPGSRAGHGSGSRQKEPQAQVAAELTRNRLEQFRWTPACR